MEPTPENASETRSTPTSIKRKADEAFDALDDALRPRTDRPSPSKRANGSIYGSLAKYGITSRSSSPTKPTSTPKLTALLSRARSKRKTNVPLIPQHTTPSSSIPEYSPGSTEAFLQRLSTYSFSTYSSKPPQIDAVAASKAGWANEGGKDRLYCSICRVGWVVAGRGGLNKDAANSLVEKQRQSLVEMHKEGCPWRVRQCDPLVYRIPLKSPTNLARQIIARAAELEPILEGIAIRHPLSSNQVQTFVQTISSMPSTEATTLSHTPPLSTADLLASLFGWSLVPSAPPLARKSSSASLTLARTHSRASSAPTRADSREGTPIPGESTNLTSQNTPPNGLGTPANGKGKPIDASTGAAAPSGVLLSRESPEQKDAMLQCRMCQRRIGLWAFLAPTSNNHITAGSQLTTSQNTTNHPQRQLDLLREHRSYCPYVVRSTPLPPLPSYPPSPTTPRTSFNLSRTGTSSSVGEAQSSSSAFNLRRSTSLLPSTSSLVHTSSPSSAERPSPSELQDHNLVEGWRAVYNTVLRYGMSTRPRVRGTLSDGPVSAPSTEPAVANGEGAEDDAMSGVIELVEGVKRHGGKQLLSYVRSLLG
ncbi:C3HC zinc finger-like-domain-containing protein [Gautieria morchelliformis]|nr:C3HC zinc finger-like-domain-containing protein [Gautieria morchelliformis]